MAGSVRFYEPCNLDGVDYEAWCEMVKGRLIACNALDCINPMRGRIMMEADPNLIPKEESIGWGDIKACEVILAALDKEVAEDFKLNYSAAQLWAALKLRFAEGKAAEARQLIIEYDNLLSSGTGANPMSNCRIEKSNWRKIINIVQGYPMSWFADDYGLDYLINAIKYSMFLYTDSKLKRLTYSPVHSRKRTKETSEETGSTRSSNENRSMTNTH